LAHFASIEDCKAIENEMPWEERGLPASVYGLLTRAKANHGAKKAVTYQITSKPGDKAKTYTWNEMHARTTQAANMFRALGVGENDTVAFVLPNALETISTLLGGMTAGIVAPINPLLEPVQIGAILRETKAKVVVTLKSFPKTDLAQKVSEAVTHAPGVQTVLEIDLLHYLSPPKSWIVPLIRPKHYKADHVDTLDFNTEMAKHSTDALTFAETAGDRVGAYFHTGGTTGMPKVAQHKHSGMIYNGWLGETLLFEPEHNIICPLPLFHVFAVHVVFMAMIASGAHVVFPTPQGYRGDGVFDNFWKLVEHHQITFVITVPTAIAAMMQRPVNADVSSLKVAFSGSAPLPVELYKRFEEATGVTIIEGYGLTEATCLVSANPPDGGKKIGSVGVPLPYTDVRILNCDGTGAITKECDTNEVGEICISNPGVFEGSTYTEEAKNLGLFAEGRYLRTGDLGRIDEDKYLFITGRAKDLIIRGGHNIDPAEIEDSLAGHPAVAFVGAIGQPDSFSGELPCAYVELVAGTTVTPDELMAHAKVHIHERAAIPKHIEILDELPKTAVGKVFKPDLRKRAITRIYDAALAKAGLPAHVGTVIDDKKLGLVAHIVADGPLEEDAVADTLGNFTRPWVMETE